MGEDEISYKVIRTAIEVQKTLGGPGLIEGVYESCLYHVNFGRESVKEGISRAVNWL